MDLLVGGVVETCAAGENEFSRIVTNGQESQVAMVESIRPAAGAMTAFPEEYAQNVRG